MKLFLRILLPISLLAAVPALALPVHLTFTGGPDGGTFQYFSKGIATRLSQTQPGFKVDNITSAGSVENICRVNAGEADFGVAYSGDVFLARNGRLSKDPKTYRNFLAVSFLYGAPAQLIVLADSGINSVRDLTGKRVAIGGVGSGAAATAKRFFTSLGLWDTLQVEYIGYTQGAAALGQKTIDALWLMAGLPTAAVVQVAAGTPIRMLDTWDAAEQSGLLKQFPFYSRIVLPAGVYSGVSAPVATFQDAALWIAGKQVPAETVELSAENIFSPEGLDYLAEVRSTAAGMTVEHGLDGVVTPVHPGARSFWQSKGLIFIPGE